MKLFQKFLKFLLLATTIGLLASIVAAGECTLLQSHPRSCAEPLMPVNTIPSVQSCSRQIVRSTGKKTRYDAHYSDL